MSNQTWTVERVLTWQRFGLDDFRAIPKTLSGVYVLLCQPEPEATLGIIYVGRSIHIKRRLREHNYTLPIDEAAVLSVADRRQQEIIESQLIYDLCPPLNAAHRAVRPSL